MFIPARLEAMLIYKDPVVHFQLGLLDRVSSLELAGLLELVY